MTDKPSLTQIARDLRAEAQAHPGEPARFELSGGLKLAVVYNLVRSPRWQISLIRPGVEPSRKEVEVVRRDFGVPDTARQEADSQTIRGVVFRIVRLKWNENGRQIAFSFDEEDGHAVATVTPTPANQYTKD